MLLFIKKTLKNNKIKYRVYLFKKIKLLSFCLPILKFWNHHIRLSKINSHHFKKTFHLNNIDQNIINSLKMMGEFDYHANGGNLGDFLIAQAEYSLFKKLGLNYHIYHRTSQNKPKENFVFGGGGGFVSYWNYQELFPLLTNKKIKNIIILPSSFYNCEDFIKLIDERFTIFCREQFSYEYLLSHKTPAKIYLSHDMATTLRYNNFENPINQIETNSSITDKNTAKKIYKEMFLPYQYIYELINKKTKNILVNENGLKVAYFLRNDKEKSTNTDLTNIKNSIDLSTCCYGTCENEIQTDLLTRLFLAAIDTTDIVITDRLHIGVGALLLHKKLIWIDNSYKKILGVYQQSFKNNEDIIFLKNTSDLPDVLKNLTCKKCANYQSLKEMNLSFSSFLNIYSQNYTSQPIKNIVTGAEND